MGSSVADGRGGEKRGERIAQTAARHGVTVATLRLYEQQGILPPASRTDGGHRRYSDADLEWIDIVMLLRGTGMPVVQMARIAELARDGQHDDVQQLISAHAQEALQRALELQRNARALLQRSASIMPLGPVS